MIRVTLDRNLISSTNFSKTIIDDDLFGLISELESYDPNFIAEFNMLTHFTISESEVMLLALQYPMFSKLCKCKEGD